MYHFGMLAVCLCQAYVATGFGAASAGVASVFTTLESNAAHVGIEQNLTLAPSWT